MVFLNIPHNAGMGNQLFMFAYAYSIAKKQKQKLTVLICNDEDVRPIIFKYLKVKDFPGIRWIVINHALDQKFKGKISGCVHRVFKLMLTKNRHIILVNGRRYQKLPLVSGGVYINGFFENYKYFRDVEEEIKELYSCDYILEEGVSELIKEISMNNSVALHIRMGDFVKLGRNFGFDYYDKAIETMKELVNRPVFYLVTTDDSVREYYRNKESIVIVDIHTNYQDIDEWNILCHCKHHITTNSTYSWWAALLAQYEKKIVIKPSRARYTDAEGAEYGKNYDDFYPAQWIELKENEE